MTTMVMRETPGCSECPTVIESMLNERRRSSETTRLSTPGWSSTRTTQGVSILHRRLLPFEPLLMQHLGVRRARRHDRPDIRFRLDHEIDQHRAADRSRPLDRRHESRRRCARVMPVMPYASASFSKSGAPILTSE